MKTPLISRKPSGFTLIELLVVISIIAVLAALGAGAAIKAQDSAKKTKALAAANAIEQAVNSFYDEYSSYPVDNQGNMDTRDLRTDQGDFINHLLALKDDLNKKEIRFLNVSQAKAKKGGLIYESDTQASLVDPWGNPYRVWLDTNFDEEIDDPLPTGNTGTSKVRGKRALVISYGPKNDFNDRSSVVLCYR